MREFLLVVSLLSVLLALLLAQWGGIGLIAWFAFVGMVLCFAVALITKSIYFTKVTVINYLLLGILSHLLWLDFQVAAGTALSGSDDTFFYQNANCLSNGNLFCRQDAFSYFLVPFITIMGAVDTQTDIGVYAITSALTALSFLLCKKLSIRYFDTQVPSWLLFSSYFAVSQLVTNSMMLYREALVLLFLYGAIYMYEGVARAKNIKIVLSFLGVAYLRVGSSIILPAFILSHLVGVRSLRSAALYSGGFILLLTIVLNILAPFVAAYGSSVTNLSRNSAFSEVSGEDVLEQRMQKRVQGSIGDGRAEGLKTQAFSSVSPINIALRFLIPTAYPVTFHPLSFNMPASDVLSNISIVLKPLVLPLVLLGMLTLLKNPVGAPLLFSLFAYALLVLLISGMPRHLLPVYWLMPIAAAIGWQKLRRKKEMLFFFGTFLMIALILVFLNG